MEIQVAKSAKKVKNNKKIGDKNKEIQNFPKTL